MNTEKIKKCIDTCNASLTECYRNATAALKENENVELSKCIRLSYECGAICHLTVKALATESDFVMEVCKLCSDICIACGTECLNHSYEYTNRCAQACFKCAEACQSLMAEQVQFWN